MGPSQPLAWLKANKKTEVKLAKRFGFLWGFGDNNTELSEEQKHMKEIFEEVRAKILDRGNTQIREIELEFVNYEISRKKFYIKLPVQNPEGEQNDG